jgi:hypothetical protein
VAGGGIAIAAVLAVNQPPQLYELSNEGLFTAHTSIQLHDPTKVASIWTSAGDDWWNGPLHIGLRARGTLQAPLVPKEGDFGLYFASGVWDGIRWERLGYMGFRVAGPITAGNTPGSWFLWLTAPGHYFPNKITEQSTDGGLWTRQQGFDGVIDLGDSPTTTWNVAAAQMATITMTDNRMLVPRNLRAGHRYYLLVKDGGAGHSLAFSNAFQWKLKGDDGQLYTEQNPLVLSRNEEVMIDAVAHSPSTLYGQVTRLVPR